MTECWINVYDDGYGNTRYSKDDAEHAAINTYFRKLLYRIHVRLK